MAEPDASGISTVDPGGPPVSLPKWEGRPPTKIDVTLPRTSQWEDAPYEPGAPSAPKVAGWQDEPYAPAKEPSKDLGTTAATVRGVGQGLLFGAQPVFAGLEKAARTPKLSPEEDMAQVDPATGMTPNSGRFLGGAIEMIRNWVSKHPDPQVQADYEAGRKAAQESNELALKQHPTAYILGNLGGMMMTPSFGAAGAAGAGGRFLSGMRAGAIGGAAYGAGSGLGEGLDPRDIAKRSAIDAVLGGTLGGPLNAAIGPRLANTATPGGRAAATAEDLGETIPRGLASDSPLVQGTTSKLRSLPFIGSSVTRQLDRLQEAAGGRVEDISGGMGGGTRAAADVAIRPGLEGAIDTGRNAIDSLYNTTRARISMNDASAMPRTREALDRVYARREGRGMANPHVGLEQAENLASRPHGANFNEAHAARANVRDNGAPRGEPHPGYDGRDYNEVVRAMTQDLEQLVGMSAARVEQRQNPATSSQQSRYLAAGRAIQNFRDAEQNFGPIAELNRRLQRLVDSRGEGAIETLLGASRAKGGDIRLLADMRRLLPPQDFERIGGTLLGEVMRTPTGDFSLAHFSNKWRNQVSDEAKNILFSPQTREALDNIAGLGTHLRGALRESNTSHTASVMVLLDVAKDALLVGHDLASSGGFGTETMVGAGTTALALILGRWLANPARASAINTWRNAYGAMSAAPNAARIASFNVATRNLANNLGVPVEKILEYAHARATGQNQDDANLK
jgi:hypothetical protein